MSLEPSQQADDGKRPAFTGRFPILAAGTPAGQGSGDQRPTFSAPASGPAEVSDGGQDTDPPPSEDETAGSVPGTSDSDPDDGTIQGTVVSTGADADEDDSDGDPPPPQTTAALRAPIRSATSGVIGTADTTRGTRTNGATGSMGAADASSTGGAVGTGSTVGTTDTEAARTAAAVGTIGTARTPGTTGNAGTGTTANADAPTTADRDAADRDAADRDAEARDGQAAGGSPGSAGTTGSAGADGLEGLDGPLLGDTVGLRSNWERLQAGFVDDPEDAVADAAELVEHTVQALIGALRQRQRALRELAKRGPAVGQGADASDPAGSQAVRPSGPDTEHLRRMMLRYRSLFNQLCRP